MTGKPNPSTRHGRGSPACVQIYTGEGKGKTTAAFGLALRAVAAGWNVFIGQFLKGHASGEADVLRALCPRVTIRRFGPKNFVSGVPSPSHRRAVRRGWTMSRRAVLSGHYDLVILDEVIVAVSLGLLPEADLLAVVQHRPPHVELVLTGRGASRRMMQVADLVTTMKAAKHYYDRGIRARRGIEF